MYMDVCLLYEIGQTVILNYNGQTVASVASGNIASIRISLSVIQNLLVQVLTI